jgi:hypothetical protein
MYAILSLAGCAIMFFGYDASVMSLVNTNKNYLYLMGAASGSKRDSAAIGGLVSLWFGGFAMGKSLCALKCAGLIIFRRSHLRRSLCRQNWSTKDHRAWLSMGSSRSSSSSISAKLHVDGFCQNYWWRRMWPSQHSGANLDV